MKIAFYTRPISRLDVFFVYRQKSQYEQLSWLPWNSTWDRHLRWSTQIQQVHAQSIAFRQIADGDFCATLTNRTCAVQTLLNITNTKVSTNKQSARSVWNANAVAPKIRNYNTANARQNVNKRPWVLPCEIWCYHHIVFVLDAIWSQISHYCAMWQRFFEISSSEKLI